MLALCDKEKKAGRADAGPVWLKHGSGPASAGPVDPAIYTGQHHSLLMRLWCVLTLSTHKDITYSVSCLYLMLIKVQYQHPPYFYNSI